MDDFEEIVSYCEKIAEKGKADDEAKWIHLDYEGTEGVE
jgi:hypothetical protein